MDTKTYIFIYFYQQYLVLLTIVLRNTTSTHMHIPGTTGSEHRATLAIVMTEPEIDEVIVVLALSMVVRLISLSCVLSLYVGSCEVNGSQDSILSAFKTCLLNYSPKLRPGDLSCQGDFSCQGPFFVVARVTPLFLAVLGFCTVLMFRCESPTGYDRSYIQ